MVGIDRFAVELLHHPELRSQVRSLKFVRLMSWDFAGYEKALRQDGLRGRTLCPPPGEDFTLLAKAAEEVVRAEVAGGFLASERDAFESFEPSETLLIAGAGFVEDLREIGRLVLLVGLVGDHRGDTPSPGGRAIGLAGISLIPEGGTRGDVRSDIQQGLEMRQVRSLAAGEIECDVARLLCKRSAVAERVPAGEMRWAPNCQRKRKYRTRRKHQGAGEEACV